MYIKLVFFVITENASVATRNGEERQRFSLTPPSPQGTQRPYLPRTLTFPPNCQISRIVHDPGDSLLSLKKLGTCSFLFLCLCLIFFLVSGWSKTSLSFFFPVSAGSLLSSSPPPFSVFLLTLWRRRSLITTIFFSALVIWSS